MSPTVFLIAKLTRSEAGLARRAVSTAMSQDDPDAPPPTEFAGGSGAMVYALAMFAARKPLHFYIGLFGLVALPIYLLIRIAEYVHGR